MLATHILLQETCGLMDNTDTGQEGRSVSNTHLSVTNARFNR